MGWTARGVLPALRCGLGVILITHNPNHAYLVGDHFVLLKRGRTVSDMTRDETTLRDLAQEMAGGAELEALEHELGRAAQTA